jgi:hypothetical protein
VLYPPWLDETEEERRHTMIHESVHVLNAPIHEFVKELTESLFGENRKDMRDVVAGLWKIAHEAATEDIAIALLNVAHDMEALNEAKADDKDTVIADGVTR